MVMEEGKDDLSSHLYSLCILFLCFYWSLSTIASLYFKKVYFQASLTVSMSLFLATLAAKISFLRLVSLVVLFEIRETIFVPFNQIIYFYALCGCEPCHPTYGNRVFLFSNQVILTDLWMALNNSTKKWGHQHIQSITKQCLFADKYLCVAKGETSSLVIITK